MVAINVKGVLHVTHAALPHLLEAATTADRGVSDLVTVSSTAGRAARSGSGVYNLTKFGVGAFAEALRQETAEENIRVTLIEPGAVATELASHLRPEIAEQAMQRFASIERLEADDIADTIAFIVTRPRRMAINEVLIRPSKQER